MIAKIAHRGHLGIVYNSCETEVWSLSREDRVHSSSMSPEF